MSLGSTEQAKRLFEDRLGLATDPGEQADLLESAGKAASMAGSTDARTCSSAPSAIYEAAGRRSDAARATASQLSTLLLRAGSSRPRWPRRIRQPIEFADLGLDAGLVKLLAQLARIEMLRQVDLPLADRHGRPRVGDGRTARPRPGRGGPPRHPRDRSEQPRPGPRGARDDRGRTATRGCRGPARRRASSAAQHVRAAGRPRSACLPGSLARVARPGASRGLQTGCGPGRQQRGRGGAHHRRLGPGSRRAASEVEDRRRGRAQDGRGGPACCSRPSAGRIAPRQRQR